MAQRRRRSLLGRGAAGGTGGADDAPGSDADRTDDLRNEDASTEVTDVVDPSPPPPDDTPPPVRPKESWPLTAAARRRSTGGELKSYAELDPAIRGTTPPPEPPPTPPPEPVVAQARPRLSLFEAARARLAAESGAGPQEPPAPPPLVAMIPPSEDPPTPASATPVIDGSGQSWLNSLAGRALPDDPVTPPSPPDLVDRARRRQTGPTPPSMPTAQVVENARAGKLYTETGVRSDDTSDPSWRDDTAPPPDMRKSWAPPTRVPTPASAPPPPPGLFDTPPGAPPAVRRQTNPSLLPEPRLVTVDPPRLAPIVLTPSGAVPATPKDLDDDDDDAEPPAEDLFQNPWVLGAVAIAVPVLLISLITVLFFGWSTPEPEVRPAAPPTPIVPPPPVVVPGDPSLVAPPAQPPAPTPTPPTAAPVAPPAAPPPAAPAKAPPKPLIKGLKEPRAQPKRDPAQTGRVKLRSNQQVLVKVNGRPADFTPFELDLAPGTYKITAALPGRPDSEQTQSVTVVAGDTLPVSFSF